jgi:hypothetical protein
MFTVLSLVLALAVFAGAQTKEKAKTPPAGQPDMAAMMAAMKPGPQHDVLKMMAGDWAITGQFWMDPKGDPMTMKPGTAHNEMILDGRYLQFVHHGEMMGMPYEGRGLMGYDNFKKVYQMTWIDNMGTTISTAAGTADASGKVISLLGKMDDPSTGKKDEDVKYVYTIKDDKSVEFAMFLVTGPKDATKIMEMMYSKK